MIDFVKRRIYRYKKNKLNSKHVVLFVINNDL